MKKFIFMAILALAVIVTSCKKDKETIIEPLPDFMHLGVGNYWVYEFYKIDTNGVETKLEETDSAFILKDSVVNGLTYFVKVQSPFQFLKDISLSPDYMTDTILLRDSSGYLVDVWGHVLFAQNNFTDILYTDTIQGLLWSETKMVGKDSLVTVPAGSFITRAICRICYPLNPGYPWGIRKSYNIYGKDAGIVWYNYGFYGSGIDYEGRLVRYK